MTTQHVVLVPCGASKQAVVCAAKDLYVSTPFREARRFAEKFGDNWYILSAKHGVVGPDELVEPYEVTLNNMSAAARREWAERVNSQLIDLLPPAAKVTILAGKNYRQFLDPFLRARGFEVRTPLAHLGIGRQIQWLQTANVSGYWEEK